MSYAEAKAKYAALGIDTDAAISKLKNVPVSLCECPILLFFRQNC